MLGALKPLLSGGGAAVRSRLTLLRALGRKGLGGSWRGPRAAVGLSWALVCPPAWAQALGESRLVALKPPAATPNP